MFDWVDDLISGIGDAIDDTDGETVMNKWIIPD